MGYFADFSQNKPQLLWQGRALMFDSLQPIFYNTATSTRERRMRMPTQIPMIGEQAPAFSAETTRGTLQFPSDYEGQWVILCSHPGDFR